MAAVPVITVFDVGKTNKKLLLFDREYQLVHERSESLEETIDGDGFPCESVESLTRWMTDAFRSVVSDHAFTIRAVNFSGYGASFVLLDEDLQVAAPLYNYLKPYPTELEEGFYERYGGREELCRRTASPALGSLNSGLQLYRLKYENPDLFRKVRHALHLPQYLSFTLSGALCSELTSVGCHTHLWDFDASGYHQWVTEEGIGRIFPPMADAREPVKSGRPGMIFGTGLHDSSAALLPYSCSCSEPFVLLSTGTWSITLNPFNAEPLSAHELQNDCLCFLTPAGAQVKASRLFSGAEHMEWTRRLSAYFGRPEDEFKKVTYDRSVIGRLRERNGKGSVEGPQAVDFGQRDLKDFSDFGEAYHQLISDLVDKQIWHTGLVLGDGGSGDIYVDGGFSRNSIFMRLLAERYPERRLYSATVSQASALGAAMILHDKWNDLPMPSEPVAKTRVDTKH
jgi:sugar (pentulose or hexulose) kinase